MKARDRQWAEPGKVWVDPVRTTHSSEPEIQGFPASVPGVRTPSPSSPTPRPKGPGIGPLPRPLVCSSKNLHLYFSKVALTPSASFGPPPSPPLSRCSYPAPSPPLRFPARPVPDPVLPGSEQEDREGSGPLSSVLPGGRLYCHDRGRTSGCHAFGVPVLVPSPLRVTVLPRLYSPLPALLSTCLLLLYPPLYLSTLPSTYPLLCLSPPPLPVSYPSTCLLPLYLLSLYLSSPSTCPRPSTCLLPLYLSFPPSTCLLSLPPVSVLVYFSCTWF